MTKFKNWYNNNTTNKARLDMCTLVGESDALSAHVAVNVLTCGHS